MKPNDSAASKSFVDLLSGNSCENLWLPVLSGSMNPTLIPGDQVLVTPCNWQQCKPGDIIVFRQGMALTAHRLMLSIALPGRRLLLQMGDDMDSGSIINAQAIVGRCITRSRGGIEESLSDHKINRALAQQSLARLIKNNLRRAVRWILRKMTISRSK